ncbi:F-BAR domain only protein 1 [Varanus komodoensis]|nr:F-BAR domain only protein 1 [Varanus komodoensis]
MSVKEQGAPDKSRNRAGCLRLPIKLPLWRLGPRQLLQERLGKNPPLKPWSIDRTVWMGPGHSGEAEGMFLVFLLPAPSPGAACSAAWDTHPPSHLPSAFPAALPGGRGVPPAAHEGPDQLLHPLCGGHPCPDRAGARGVQAEHGEHWRGDAAAQLRRKQGDRLPPARLVGVERDRHIFPAPCSKEQPAAPMSGPVPASNGAAEGSGFVPGPALRGKGCCEDPKVMLVSFPPAGPLDFEELSDPSGPAAKPSASLGWAAKSANGTLQSLQMLIQDDSDYDDEEPHKFYVRIKPIQPRERTSSAVAVEQLKASVGSLILPPGLGCTMKRHSSRHLKSLASATAETDSDPAPVPADKPGHAPAPRLATQAKRYPCVPGSHVCVALLGSGSQLRDQLPCSAKAPILCLKNCVSAFACTSWHDFRSPGSGCNSVNPELLPRA